MTKNFCDKCGKEVPEKLNVHISLSGNTSREKLFWKNLYLCEDCYLKASKKLNSIFSNQTPQDTI